MQESLEPGTIIFYILMYGGMAVAATGAIISAVFFKTAPKFHRIKIAGIILLIVGILSSLTAAILVSGGGNVGGAGL
jgi:hypothetical protein